MVDAWGGYKLAQDLGFPDLKAAVEHARKSFVSWSNPLLATDVYKMGHMEQYRPGTTKVYSYLTARSDKTYKNLVFFGLRYWVDTYLSRKITPAMAEEFIENKNAILGLAKSTNSTKTEAEEKIRSLGRLGYIPLEIRAVKEGTVLPVKNCLVTITNTLDEFYWCVGFFESLLLKVWDSITTASCSYAYRQLVEKYYKETVDQGSDCSFQVHDFGYRGCSSEEQAALTGAAHLLSFKGSDTVVAREWIKRQYGVSDNYFLMSSVPASEHSVMCSFGQEDELSAFRNMLSLYPEGIVSIVSDTFNVYEVLTTFAKELKEAILSRPFGSKVVFRPDSGNPEYIICGDPNAKEGTPEQKGALTLLGEVFGYRINSKGYKVLNPKVGLIYGDGMYLERYERTLQRMKDQGWSAENLVIGVGGILRNHSRDTLGLALKATYIEVNGRGVNIEKNPVTDKEKKSHKGIVSLFKDLGGYYTRDKLHKEDLEEDELEMVYYDGPLSPLGGDNFESIRNRVQQSLKGE